MTTQDLINTLKQGRPMTDKLMREIVRELEEKNEQLHTMATALRAKDADYAALLATHNALEARVKHMNVWSECDKCGCLFIPGGKGSETSCATCIKEEHAALVEAVKKMLEAYKRAEECSCPYCLEDFEKARAEVSALVGEEVG